MAQTTTSPYQQPHMANVGAPTLINDLEIGDKIYVGNRQIEEVADKWPEFGGYTILSTTGRTYWYSAGTRVRRQVLIDNELPAYCTTVCERGHDRYRFSRSSDGGFTFICVYCIYGKD